MQIPYHIKVTLQEYYENFSARPTPDFSNKCPICGGVDCATLLGYYERTAICPITGFSTSHLAILRYRCHDKGDARVCNHITFSLLPYELVPFRQLSLNFMVKAIWIKLNRDLSLTRLMDAIEDELNCLDDVADFINISTIISWQRMIMIAVELFISSDINMISKVNHEQLQDMGLHFFLNLLINHQSQINNYPIRGPNVFALDYYQQSGGIEKFAPFLFGRASQHRN